MRDFDAERFSRPDLRRDRVTDNRAQLGETAGDRGVHEAVIAGRTLNVSMALQTVGVLIVRRVAISSGLRGSMTGYRSRETAVDAQSARVRAKWARASRTF